MPTTPSGYRYYSTLTDGNGTSLPNFVCRIDLTSSNFDFTKPLSSGADFRVYDVTNDANLPYWLQDYDSVAQTGRLFFKATGTGNAHRLYYGNSDAVTASSFSTVFGTGTGFDSGWGDLSANASGSGVATRLAAWDGTLASARFRQVYKRSNTAAVGTAQWANRPVVREFTILTDATGKIVQDGGVYVAYYIAQNTSNSATYPGQTYRCTSSDLITWSNHTLVLAAGPGTYDDRGARVATVLKVASGDYRMWYTATGTVTVNGLGYATSTDGLTWTKYAGNPFMTSANCGITDVAPILSGVPDVLQLLDGTYVMLCESRQSTGTGYPWKVYGWSSPNATNGGTWTVLNSGNPLISTSNGMTTWGAANPHLWQRGATDFLIMAQGFSGSTSDLTTFNGNVGWWTASAMAGPWTFDSNGPIAGRINVSPSNFGTESSGIALLVDAPITHIQDYPASDNLNTVGNVYRTYPVVDRLGLLNTTAAADAAIASMTLASGTFAAENRIGMTAHRSGDNTVYCLALSDSATAVSPDTSTNILAAMRVAIRRSTFCANQATSPGGLNPGDISFLYTDGSAALHYWKNGWTFTGGSYIASNGSAFGNPAAAQGSQVAVLQQTCAISQLVPGWNAGDYTIRFSAAQRGSFNASQQDLAVLIDGVSVGTVTPVGSAFATYETPTFTVTKGSHTITFQGLDTAGGDNTAFIDNVVIPQTGAPYLTNYSFENPSVGGSSFTLRPTDGGWGTTTTDIAVPSDCLREIVARIDDDGTNFVISVYYADVMLLIASTSIAKASVKAFSAGRALFAGVPFTNTNYGGAYSRQISTRSYAATEPSILVGSQIAAGGIYYHSRKLAGGLITMGSGL